MIHSIYLDFHVLKCLYIENYAVWHASLGSKSWNSGRVLMYWRLSSKLLTPPSGRRMLDGRDILMR